MSLTTSSATDLQSLIQATKGVGISFGTGSRPPLNNITSLSPGPGAYPLKSTLSKQFVSNLESPSQISISSRQKFGDPYSKANDKSTALEPGPGHYSLQGKFLKGKTPEKYSFPKSPQSSIKNQYAPGPGSYEPLPGLGKQVLSTRHTPENPFFPKSNRSGLYNPATTDIGPGEYGAPPAACEVQVDSRKKTCANSKFGTGYVKSYKGNQIQKADLSEPLPGPGAYVIPGNVGSSSMVYRSSPKPSMSGRTAFGSPWKQS